MKQFLIELAALERKHNMYINPYCGRCGSGIHDLKTDDQLKDLGVTDLDPESLEQLAEGLE